MSACFFMVICQYYTRITPECSQKAQKHNKKKWENKNNRISVLMESIPAAQRAASQSDREANECWLNRWVVVHPHTQWRGVSLLCVCVCVRMTAGSVLPFLCKTVRRSDGQQGAEQVSGFLGCLYNSPLFHWHFCDRQEFLPFPAAHFHASPPGQWDGAAAAAAASLFGFAGSSFFCFWRNSHSTKPFRPQK